MMMSLNFIVISLEFVNQQDPPRSMTVNQNRLSSTSHLSIKEFLAPLRGTPLRIRRKRSLTLISTSNRTKYNYL